VTSWTEDRKEEDRQPVGLIVLDFRIRSVTSWTEDQEGGGGQQPVGHTVMDFRIMSVTSWTEDRMEEVNICPTVLDFRIRSVTSWTKDRKEEDTQPVGLLTGLQDQVNDLVDGGQEGQPVGLTGSVTSWTERGSVSDSP
jgi:hypothetical protein